MSGTPASLQPLALSDRGRYRDEARRLSALMRDEKETPLERAVWWVEYVGRHRGAPHLRSPALDVPWYQVRKPIDQGANQLMIGRVEARINLYMH